MNYISKSLDELNVLDDFLMNTLASDPEVGVPFCRILLSVLLQREIDKIRIIAQRTIPALTPKMRGIRMDVEIEELADTPQASMQESTDSSISNVCNIYDIEPHLQKNINLPKHNRFYQAKIDSRYMHSGNRDFSQMPNLYMLTITNYDPFGYDYMMYTIKNQCVEVSALDYEDGIRQMYFYTKGRKGGCKDLRNMLNYLQESIATNVTDSATQAIHDYVSKVKIQPEVRLEYMKFDEILYYAKQEGHTEGLEEATRTNIYDLLEDCGKIPDSLRDYLNAQSDLEVLKHWLKLAAHSTSMETFMEQIGCVTNT
ncbi:MAG: hypothetical protein IJ711_09495 [Lachnospiraceae bacterium]|nr:hypothetical protein [Lachnospiraceae bacterium]